MADELGAQSLAYLNTSCGTCYHRRGVHYKSYDGSHTGCKGEVGRAVPIPCPCEGYMATESEALRDAYHAAVGMDTYHAQLARQDRKYSALYIKEHFSDEAANDGHGET